MRARGQLTAALVVLALVVGGGAYLEQVVGARAFEAEPRGRAPSGAWLCPHGGGPADWTVTLSVANPGPDPVSIYVRNLGSKKPEPGSAVTVEPGSVLHVPAVAAGRERASIVEFFGGWVAVGWVAHAGGSETGVAAEPCLAAAGRTWLLADGTTETDKDYPYVVVMNPFAADAVVTVTLFTERRLPIRPKEWSDVLLPAHRSVAFPLNENSLGDRTVSARVDASIGRVAAASLDVRKPEGGGIRSAVGLLGDAPHRVILPGGIDQGRTELVVMNSEPERAGLGAILHGREGEQTVAALEGAAQPGESAGTYPVSTEGPSTIDLRAVDGGVGVAVARRTYGVNSDQGATAGAASPEAAWIVLPTVAGEPNTPGLFLWNPGPATARVTLSFLSPEGDTRTADPIIVEVPPGRTLRAPEEFLRAGPTAAVLADAEEGTFVPVAASYSFGLEGLATYAVSVGVPIPPRWIPG